MELVDLLNKVNDGKSFSEFVQALAEDRRKAKNLFGKSEEVSGNS